MSKEKINLLGEKIEFKTNKSKNATKPRIDVDMKGIRVIIPEGDQTNPEELIRNNARWVLDKKDKYEKYWRKAQIRIFEEGEKFPYLGLPMPIHLENVSENKISNSRIVLSKSKVEKSSIKEEIEKLYREKARDLFTVKVKKYSKQIDVDYNKIMIWNQRTRWASCSSKKNLSFNWRLLMAPEKIIDYIVVHELAHLIEKNHTKEFWNIVEKYIPDYEQREEWLKENGIRLIFTKDDLSGGEIAWENKL